MKSVIVHHNWSVALETATETTNHKVDDPAICEPATDVEVLDWQLTDHCETKKTSNLSAGSIVGPVEVRTVDRSGDFFHLSTREPASKDSKLTFSFRSPGGHDFLKVVLGHTEANQVVVLNVL